MGFFSKDIKTMNDLFVHTLRDMYYAEKQIVQALPEMIDKAADPQLKRGFETHRSQSEPPRGVDLPHRHFGFCFGWTMA
jgi:hypothetical protein